MKNKLLLKLIAAIALLWILPFGAKAQNNPSYFVRIMNDHQISPTEYVFDVNIQRTGTTDFQFASMAGGFLYNKAGILQPGATLTCTVDPYYTVNLCNHNVQANITLPQSGTAPNIKYGIKMTLASPACGVPACTHLSDVYPGNTVVRLKMTSNMPFVPNSQFNWSYNFTTLPGNTQIFHYNSTGVTTICTNMPASCLTTDPVNNPDYNNPPLNPPTNVYTLGGGGAICPGGSTLVTLDGSQIGKDYQLFLDGIAYQVFQPGTGLPLNWTVTDAGTYTCMTDTTHMAGSPVVTITPLPLALGPITGPANIAPGSTGNVYSVGVNSFFDVWAFTAGTPAGLTLNTTGTNIVTIDVAPGTPAGGPYQLAVKAQDQCGQYSIESFFDIWVEVQENPPAPFPVAGGGAICEGDLVGVPVILTNSEIGVNYDLFLNAQPVAGWAMVPGNGGPINFGPFVMPGVYTITGTNAGGTTPMVNPVNIIVNPAPAPPVSLTPLLTVCEAALPGILIDSVGPGIEVFWYDAATGGNLLTPTPSPTYSSMVAGTFWNVAYDPITQCYSLVRTPSTLVITPLTYDTITVVQCGGTYTFYGTVYSQSGTYTYVDMQACVSHTLILTINTMTFAQTEVVVQCGGTYDWHGTTYPATGIYTYEDNVACITYTLDLTINTMTMAQTEVVVQCGGTYTWNGTVYAATGIYTYVDNVACITYTLDLTINTMTMAQTEVVVQCGGTYTWNGTVYATTGIYTYVDAQACITYTLDLTINTMTMAQTEVVVQCGGTYDWHGTTYPATGIYTYVDNVACITYTLDLTINTMTMAQTEVVVQCGGTYTWNGTVYAATGIYTYVDAQACITYTLDLTINTMFMAQTEVVVQCGGTYTWNGTVYAATGIYTYVDAQACITYTLDLTINTMTMAQTEVVVQCGGTYDWHGTTYPATGIYTYVDNVACITYTLDLTINTMTMAQTEVVVQCGGTYTWNGTVYAATGIYTYVDAQACITYTLDLTINTMFMAQTEVVVQCGGTYTWNGTVYAATGIYTYVDAQACITYTLDLTINTMTMAQTEVVVQCGGTYDWHGTTYPATGIYTYVDNVACITYTLDLTINTMTMAQTEVVVQCGGTYTWNGTVYAATGIYTYVDAQACITYTLDLTINTMFMAQTEVVVQCGGTYTWNGTVYAATGIYTYVDAQACITYTLDLTINTMFMAQTEVVVQCGGTYDWHGTTYPATGIYTYVDNVACITYTLDLTINTMTMAQTEVVVQCGGTYTWNGTVYAATGIYTYVDAQACITYTLDLTINTMFMAQTEVVVQCGGTYTWNGTVYAATGIYTYVDAQACITYTLDLTINVAVTPTFTLQTAYFQGATPQALPLISNNGIAGTWAPPVISTATVGQTTYLFTPDAGLCANPYSLIVTVNPAVSTFQTANDIGTTLMLLWPPVSGAGVYACQWRPLGSTGAWMAVSAPVNASNGFTGNFAKLTNLTPGLPYECRVKAYTPTGAPITGLQTGTFTSTVVTFVDDFDMGTTCKVSWPDWAPWATSYSFQYRTVGGVWSAPIITYFPEAKLSNLTPDTDYECKVNVYKGLFWGTTQTGIIHTDAYAATVSGTGTSLTIDWSDFNAGDVTNPWVGDQYVRYKLQGASAWLSQYVAPGTFTATLSGLAVTATPYEYQIYVYLPSTLAGGFWGSTPLATFVTSLPKEMASGNIDVNIYPNPFVDQVNMDIFTPEETKVTWNIYDMTGKVVLSGSESMTTGYSTLNIDASELSKGVYMLNAIVNDQIQSFRIMKQ